MVFCRVFIFKIIELDVMLVVNLLRKEGHNPNGNDTIIADYKEGLSKIPREANKCANALTRRGALLPQDFVLFSFPPADVALLLSLDAAGTMYECNCAPLSVV